MRHKRCLLHSPLVGHQVQENGLRSHPRPWKWKELGLTERPGRPGRKTAYGTSGTQSKAMKAHKEEKAGEDAEELRRVVRAREPSAQQRRVHETKNHALAQSDVRCS